MKKVGIVANTSWNILNFRLGLIQALQKAGHSVTIIAPYDEHSKTLAEMGFEIEYIKGLSRKGKNPLKDILLIIELAKIYRKKQLDIVLQYTIKPNVYGTFASLFSKTKTISTVTGLGYVFLNKSIGSMIAKWLYRIAFKFSNLVFFQNSDDKKLFEDTGLVPKSKSRLINGSGIDTDYFSPDYCSNNPIEKPTTTFLMTSRLLIDKGVREYMEAAKKIKLKFPEANFLLIGDQDTGNPAAVPESEIQQWGKEGIVQLLGFKKNIRDFICQADIIVLPSYREGLPRVIIEAFAMGKPCITTDAPGCKHTVDDKVNGLICQVANAESLTQKMEEFLTMDKGQKLKMGANARNKAINLYSIQIIANTYLKLIEEL